MKMTDISPRLIDQVQEAFNSGQPLKIVGSGSKQGCLSRIHKGALLDVSGHSGIVDYQPTELVLTARAGTSLAEIEKTLDDAGQTLAFEPPYLGAGATIGGTLACNLSGPSRAWVGSVRDMTLGVRLINGKGEHLRFGGQVMKNVAGYDASRLQAGALGALGVLTEVSLKVLPKPEEKITLTYKVDEASAIKKMNSLNVQAKPLSGATWSDGLLYIRLSGAQAAVAGTVKQWGGDILADDDAFWEGIREFKNPFFQSDAPLWRFSVKQSATPFLTEAKTLLDWGGAQRWVLGDYDLSHMEEIARQAGGHVVLFKGGDRTGEVRQSLDPLQQKLQSRLKQSFDPKSIFNPGCLYSWM